MARKKESSSLDMIKPASFFTSQNDKVKLNWFFYELSMAIYDNLKKSIGLRLKRNKISDQALADFSVYYSKGMKPIILKTLSGEIESIYISYEPVQSFFPSLEDGLINKMTDAISRAWEETLSICEICPNRCISEKDAYCTMFDDDDGHI